MSGPAALEMTGAHIGYRGQAVVHDLDLRVDDGEVVAILGANGSGKSTAVRGALGIAMRLAGEVRLFGQPLEAFRDRGRVGYVPQNHTLGTGVPSTVTEVVAAGRLSRVRPWRRMGPADHRRVADAIEAVGLTHRARMPVAELSGGQQRRVLIARALASDPELLVLDEPTAGVDLENQAALSSTLAELSASGATIVLIAHELGPMAPLVDRVVVMQGGRKVFDGPRGDAPTGDHGHDWHHHHGEPPASAHGLGLGG
jgi:zinc transport system ATP-binding protein